MNNFYMLDLRNQIAYLFRLLRYLS